MTRTPQHEAVVQALQRDGYSVDLEQGRVLNALGVPLGVTLTRSAKDGYPKVKLRGRTVPVHKVVAYVLWGDNAFAPGIHVRHLDGNRENTKASNLALGTPSQNAFDKPADVRSAMAKVARAAQKSPCNKILNEDVMARLIKDDPFDLYGHVKIGFLGKWAQALGITKSAISQALKKHRLANPLKR